MPEQEQQDATQIYSPEELEQARASEMSDVTPVSERTPYVRERPKHKRVEPIDDFVNEEAQEPKAVNDSAYTGRASMLSGAAYRRSRNDMKDLRRNLHYGQYLEIPKGRRDIFVKRERKSKWLTVLALIVTLAVVALAAYYCIEVLQNTFGRVF